MLLLAAALFAQQPQPQTSTEDDRIYDAVKNVLAVDRDVRGAAIEVIVKDGAITLRGQVRDEKAREKAAKVAKKVKGVKTVTNELKLWNEK